MHASRQGGRAEQQGGPCSRKGARAASASCKPGGGLKQLHILHRLIGQRGQRLPAAVQRGICMGVVRVGEGAAGKRGRHCVCPCGGAPVTEGAVGPAAAGPAPEAEHIDCARAAAQRLRHGEGAGEEQQGRRQVSAGREQGRGGATLRPGRRGHRTVVHACLHALLPPPSRPLPLLVQAPVDPLGQLLPHVLGGALAKGRTHAACPAVAGGAGAGRAESGASAGRGGVGELSALRAPRSHRVRHGSSRPGRPAALAHLQAVRSSSTVRLSRPSSLMSWSSSCAQRVQGGHK